MRLLILSRSYAPRESPRAYRWTSIAEHWAARGHAVDVVCERVGRLPSFHSQGGVSVHRVGMPVLRPAGSPEASRTTPLSHSAPWLKAGFGRFGKGLALKAWTSLRWPDDACLWAPPAIVRARSLLRRHRFDALISVSDPFTSHLAALVATRDVSGLLWVADIGDPFSLLSRVPRNNGQLYASLNRRLESAVLGGCAAASFTSEATREAYRRLYPREAGKFAVIPPVVPEAPPIPAGPVFGSETKIRLVFSGTLDLRTRNPEYLLRLFSALRDTHLRPRLELHFFGRTSDCRPCFAPYESLIGSALHLHGAVGRDVVHRALREADVLVSLGFDESPLQLPSKVVEYADTGKPVLDIFNRDGDCSHEFFASYPRTHAHRVQSAKPPRESVESLVRFIESPPTPNPSEVSRLLAPSRLPEVAESYLRLLQPGGAR